MPNKILTIAFALVLSAVPCFAEWSDVELEPNVQITATEMKEQLRQAPTRVVYVREAEDESVTAYLDTDKVPALAKMIALNLAPDQMTYVYTNDKKIYKDLASRLRYYAGRGFNFNGYRIITEKEGGKFVDGREVYRLWVMKVESPQEVVIYDPDPPVVIDLWGWPWSHHHHYYHRDVYHHDYHHYGSGPSHHYAPPPPPKHNSHPAPAPRPAPRAGKPAPRSGSQDNPYYAQPGAQPGGRQPGMHSSGHSGGHGGAHGGAHGGSRGGHK